MCYLCFLTLYPSLYNQARLSGDWDGAKCNNYITRHVHTHTHKQRQRETHTHRQRRERETERERERERERWRTEWELTAVLVLIMRLYLNSSGCLVAHTQRVGMT